MTTPRRIRARPRPQPLRLIEPAAIDPRDERDLSLGVDPSGAPAVFMRLGGRDLDGAARAIAAGARPAAMVTAVGEAHETNQRARRVAAQHGLPWFNDPLLFETALPGYRTKRHLQDLDYTPGRDGAPFQPHEFDAPEMIRFTGRTLVSSQLARGASGVFTGAFISAAPADEWAAVNAKLTRISLDAADAFGARTKLVVVPLRMMGYDSLEAQRLLVRSLAARRPTAYLLMLDGLHEASAAPRLVSALRLALLLQATGVPVILGRAGALRVLFAAFGVRGAEVGLGRLLRFAIPDFRRRGGPGPVPLRFEVPSLVFPLPADQARQVLARELVPDAECACPACRDASGPAAVERVVEHDAHLICRETRELAGVPPAARVEALDARLRHADHLWRELVRAGIAGAGPARVEAWRRALHEAVHGGLLGPDRLAEQLRLFT